MNLLNEVNHRSFPVAKEPWLMAQTWSHLLFAHYPVSKSILRSLIPKCFEIDTFEGNAWISIVPFKMSGLRIHGIRELPFTPEFAELNVRTYVTFGGRPGVYFFSLDANSKLAVILANSTYNLPYMHAEMKITQQNETINFYSKRTDSRAKTGIFSGTYRPAGDVYRANPGTLEHWLTERYILYAIKETGVYEGNVHHNPWPLQHAEATIQINTVAESMGIPIQEPAPLLHYCEKLDVIAWKPKKVGIYQVSDW